MTKIPKALVWSFEIPEKVLFKNVFMHLIFWIIRSLVKKESFFLYLQDFDPNINYKNGIAKSTIQLFQLTLKI